MPVHPADVAVAHVAARQCGLVSRSQAVAAGADDSFIRRRLRAGRWQSPSPGVYGFPGHPSSFERSLWLAVLAAPDGAVVSHESAAALHGLTGFPRKELALSVPHGTTHVSVVASVHQTVAPATPVSINGLPVTPLPRTFVDLAKVVGPRRLGRALDDAILGRRCGLERVRREFLHLARPGRTGIVVMRTVLDRRGPGFVPSASELERALDAVIAGIPGEPPIREAPFPGRARLGERVDRLFLAPPLIVEGDGREWHARVDDFVRDRQRDREALRHGYPTARFAYEELVYHPEEVRSELRALLGR